MSAGPITSAGLRNYESGLRNGYRPRRVQTAEGELEVEIPQVREAAEPFVSALFPHATKLLRTRPLEAMVVGAFVRGLSMRDVESLCEEAGLGQLSKSTASRICAELRDRFEAFGRRDLLSLVGGRRHHACLLRRVSVEGGHSAPRLRSRPQATHL